MAPRLAALGTDLTVISHNRGGDPVRECADGIEVRRPLLFDACDLVDLLTESGASTLLPSRKDSLSASLLYDILAASTAISDLARAGGRRFDLVAAHDWLATLAGVIVAKNLDLPFVFHFHSTEQGRHGGEGSAVRETIERMAAARADLVVTVSYAMLDEMIGLGYDGSRTRVVYNGVDPAKYNPSSVSPDEVAALRERLGAGERPLLLFVGRLSWVKGIEQLLLAMPSIVRAVPDLRLVLVGVGELEAEVRDLIRQGEASKSTWSRSSGSCPSPSGSCTMRRPTSASFPRGRSRSGSSAPRRWPWASRSWSARAALRAFSSRSSRMATSGPERTPTRATRARSPPP